MYGTKQVYNYRGAAAFANSITPRCQETKSLKKEELQNGFLNKERILPILHDSLALSLEHPKPLVLLRRANLSTTQVYLGRVPDTEPMKWIENLYA